MRVHTVVNARIYPGAVMLEMIQVIPIVAGTVSWLLTTAKDSMDLFSKVRASKSGMEGLLVRLASDRTHRKHMQELYATLDDARPLAEALLRRGRRRALLSGFAWLATASAVWFLFLPKGGNDAYGVLSLVLFIVGGVLLGRMRRVLALLGYLTAPTRHGTHVWRYGLQFLSYGHRDSHMWPARDHFSKGASTAREETEGGSLDLAAARAVEFARDAVEQGASEMRRLSQGELEKEFLKQFMVTVETVERLEAALLNSSLVYGQRNLQFAYRDQIADRIASKLEELLEERFDGPKEHWPKTPEEFAVSAYRSLSELGYNELLAWSQQDLAKLVDQDVINGYRTGEPVSMIKRIRKWEPYLALGKMGAR